MSELNNQLEDIMQVSSFICIGPNVWGKGATPTEAIANCRKQYGRPLREYDLHLVHMDTVVNEMGGFTWKSGAPAPVKIDSVRIKVKAVKR
jgi:hypothetical protein